MQKTEKKSNEAATKAPLGLRPRHIVESLRMQEILEACHRYSQAGVAIPIDWLLELEELNGKLPTN